MSDNDNYLGPSDEAEEFDFELLQLLDDIKPRIGEERPILEAPPAGLWEEIQKQIDAEKPAEFAADNTSVLSQTESVVTSLDHHRRKRRPAGVLLTAVAASVVAAIAVASVVRNDSRIVGEVELATLADQGAPSLGTAIIVEEDGATRLDINFNTGLVGAGDTYELWIIDSNVDQMYSLGQIGSTGDGDKRSYEIPEGVDIRDFPIVDISLEPDDGNPAHSGDSHFRGVLNA
jgi:anti-sigma-K factor RskA